MHMFKNKPEQGWKERPVSKRYGSGPGRDNEDSDQDHGAGKWSHSRCKLKVQSAGCPDKLDVGCEKKKIQMSLKFFGLSKQKE